MQRVIVALALSAGATSALQFAQPVRPVSKHVMRAEADAPVTAADIEDAAEAAEEAPVVAAEGEAAAEEKPKRKSKKDATPLDQLVVGDSYDGTITGVAAYGAFVDIGAQSDGLVHISELSTEFVSDVSAVVSEGDAVSVRVLKVDEQKKQLSLSLKPEGAAAPPKRGGGGRRTKKAGADELRKYLDADPQEFVEGTVRTVLSWGAFVNIAEGVDGLVHISRVSDDRVEDLEAMLSPGDKVQVRVVEVDLEKATLALAMNTYRDPSTLPPRRARDDGDGESAAARRARDPDAKFGGQRKPKRRDPGDDIWDNTDDFVWKDVLEKAENEDDMSSGFVVDEKGVLTLM
mmetsp:Transcript_26411/g.68630  ORF Transcript_26411/g.68630 Transcript_26411/m.68630 type:complete len:346 (+) Transcript_26411:115-1152(+)